MTLHQWAAIAALAAVTGCARPTPEQQILNDAAAALGGRDRILAVTTLTLQGGGTQYNLGQDVVPGATGQTFTVTGYTRTIDVAGGRTRTELTRQPNFAFFQGPAPQKQVNGLAGDVAYNVAPNGTATRAGGTALVDRRMDMVHHPITAVRAALTEGASLTNARTENGRSLVDVNVNGQAFTLAIDDTTKLPVTVSHKTDNVNLGDVVISTTFADYQDISGLQLPARLTVKTDDFTTADYRLTSQAVDGNAGDLAAPAAAASAPAPAAAPAVTTTAESLAPGIWLIGGGSHHSVLIEFADHLMLIEAPQNEARAQAAIAKARETVPGKPLTQLVNSHHHFDHSGGVRAAIAEGLTVITHEGNRAFFEEMAKRPHTLTPDALQNSPKPVTIDPVGADGKVFTDGTMTVNLYPVTGAHSETMLMAYVPKERILIEVDVYTPGAAAQSFAGKFLADVRARNLRVDRIIPLHGMPAPFAQLVKEAGTPATATN